MEMENTPVEKNNITIRNEDEAFHWLGELINGREMTADTTLKLEGWPVFSIRIEGEDFDGTMPTRIMPPLLNLQKEVNRLYCVTRYGQDNLNKLTDEDREQLELVVKVKKGSSWYDTLLQEPLIKAFTDAASRMTPTQLTITLISFGLFTTGSIGWKMWLSHREKMLELNSEVEQSKLDLEKQKLLVAAAQGNPTVQQLSNNIGEVRRDLLKQLREKDTLILADGEKDKELKVSGEYASEVSKIPREETAEEIIEGKYTIYSVIFNPDNFRLELLDKDGQAFVVKVPNGTLNHKQKETLKNNGFERRPISMNLLLAKRHGKVVRASLISLDTSALE
uniref:Uncharacterized protein n=1 Tax=uncultured Thiotrichaceae bacterium TaxID=298394 RepID=A0A6S6UIN4_9GAMM|nr:MAG: Unknown protein [uncultured Thiotrichaceae bacterium]